MPLSFLFISKSSPSYVIKGHANVYSELPIILNPPGPVRGYRFVNWYNTAGQVVTVIPAGTTGDLILYARWAPASDMLSSTSDVRLKQHHSSAKINHR